MPKRPFTFDDLMTIERVSTPSVHPSGKYVAFVVSKHDHKGNKVRSTVKLLDMGTLEVRDLTPGEHKDTSPVWSPDGKMLSFVSDREDGQQLWLLPFENGGEARKVTSGDGGISNPVWAADSSRLAFSRNVVVSDHWDGSSEGITGDDKEKERTKLARTYGLVNERSSARIEEDLLFRHWDNWRDMKRSHLFVLDIGTGDMNDIIPADADVPPISLGGTQDFVFSPEGNEIAYVMNPDPVVAVSTNNSVFIQRLKGIQADGRPKQVTKSKAMELEPRYSPDGKCLMFLGAEKEGYEADRLRVKLLDRRSGKVSTLTEGFDRSPAEPVWSEQSDRLYFLSADTGYNSLYSVDLEGDVRQHTSFQYNSLLRAVPGGKLIVGRESATRPIDLFLLSPGKGVEPMLERSATRKRTDDRAKKLTSFGDILKDSVVLSEPEEFWYKGADDDPVHGFIFKPPFFKEGKRYPMVLLIHGGPQSAFSNNFHYRWNPQLFAARGWVVVQLNPRGSTGYGQEFTDQISGDWGGRCYEDIMKGVDHVLERYPFIDERHMAAAGASFGGFMVNWMQGHTDRFRALVSHDGIFNQETMSYMTEELWFDIWEHKGMPHEGHESFLKYSPHMFVQNFKTPMLVVQGELDFRCPVSEGISLFTALQVMKVPSRLLYFPDEGHWVMKPANAEVWYRTVLDFIEEQV
ncbi:MAG: S9 family peptidase [Candidatus Thermoplasmatota archaeon]|jgi:dipeptidyl aminopeptidase/acylaminoacyl peptidase|nr:S9 family peptidase [Candidatus Thermoplasmatota archaeon]